MAAGCAQKKAAYSELAAEQPAVSGCSDGEDSATPPAPPMLHIWVNGWMSVSAVSASMHSFVAAPAGKSWALSRLLGGPPLGDGESPQSLHLAEGDLLFATLTGGPPVLA